MKSIYKTVVISKEEQAMGELYLSINRKEKTKRISAFPNWVTAEKMIRLIIAPEIKARVWHSVEVEAGTVKIMFLPQRAFYLVPPEDVDEFECRYNRFAEWVGGSLGLYDYFEKNLKNRPMNQKLCEEIEFDVNTKIEEYNCTHFPTITEKFIEFMVEGERGR